MAVENIFPFDASTLPVLSKEAAWERRELLQYQIPEEVPHIAVGEDHREPAEIASQRLRVVASEGIGYLPFESSHPDLEAYLNPKDCDRGMKVLEDIQVLDIVTHGVLRNAKDYFQWYIKSLGDEFNEGQILVVAPQFPAPVDPVDRRMLRWGFNDWRGGEPALAPSPPISSFAAKDMLVAELVAILPNLKMIRFRGNSEGGQMDDRYMAFSQYIPILEATTDIKVFGRIFNPGSLLYFNESRPELNSFDDVLFKDWMKLEPGSLANRWPFGLYDGKHPLYGPVPYIREGFAAGMSLEYALLAYAKRAMLHVGAEDNNPNGSQLPIEIGPREQGATRLQRVMGKYQHVVSLLDQMGVSLAETSRGDGMMNVFQGLGHSALHIFSFANVTSEAKRKSLAQIA